MKNILALTLLFFSTTAFGYFSHADGVIGTLMLPEVFGTHPCNEFRPQEIPIFKSPEGANPFGKIFIVHPRAYSADDEGCEYVANVLEYSASGSPERRSKLPTLDGGAIVLSQKKSWGKIALHKGTAWVKITNTENFWPVEKLLMNHLTFLRTGYPVPLTAEPGASTGYPIRVTGSHIPAEVLELKHIDGKIWVKVKSHPKPQCDGEERPAKPFSGWLPFHDAQGQPTVWYFSKGC